MENGFTFELLSRDKDKLVKGTKIANREVVGIIIDGLVWSLCKIPVEGLSVDEFLKVIYDLTGRAYRLPNMAEYDALFQDDVIGKLEYTIEDLRKYGISVSKFIKSEVDDLRDYISGSKNTGKKRYERYVRLVLDEKEIF